MDPSVELRTQMAVDNYCESQVDNAVTVVNTCTVDGVDTIAAMAIEYIKLKKLKGSDTAPVGRSFDLKSAYWQLAVSDSTPSPLEPRPVWWPSALRRVTSTTMTMRAYSGSMTEQETRQMS